MIVMTKYYNIPGNFTQQEKETFIELIDDFRVLSADFNPENNIAYRKKSIFTDTQIISFYELAVGDLNSGLPRTNFTALAFGMSQDRSLLVLSAVIFSLISEGILHTRNNVSYNDNGLSVNMFNKGPELQSWAGFLLNTYLQRKADFKRSIVLQKVNAGFSGVASEYFWNGVY